MRTSTRGALWAIVVAAACLVGAADMGAGQGGGSGQSEWTGTVTVTETASGSVKGGTASLGFTGRQTVTYSLNGDGTATWSGSVSSTLDMSGLYKIPTTGSGGGFGYGGASFDGGVWSIVAAPEDDMPTTTDHTAEDRVWLDKGPARLAVEIAKALGQPPPRPGKRVEKGRFSPLGASVPMRAAGNVTTLASSTREINSAERLGGPGTIPSTINYSWNLHRGPVQPHVKIYGKECGCIDPDTNDATVKFIAGASPTGGEFSEFIVTSDGKMPEILSNEGGEQPRLEVRGTKDTGAVTLRIRYTRNGVTQQSPPFKVDFCAIDEIELKDKETDLAFDLDGKLVTDAKAKMWRGGKEVSTELEWDLDKMGAPTSLTADPSNKKGDHIKFTYENMPRANADFGEKTLSAKATGKCDCRREETIRTFYPDVDSNHPDDGTPNWFYYFKQTSAVSDQARGLLRYEQFVADLNAPEAAVIAKYDHVSERLLISSRVFEKSACRGEVDRVTHLPTGRKAEGIDCFAEIVRHEFQHRLDAIDWWGTPKGVESLSGLSAAMDADGDHLPTRLEATTPGCSSFSKRSCNDRPFADVTDAEINAYWAGWTWPVGAANAEDWSCGELSKQWKGKKCG